MTLAGRCYPLEPAELRTLDAGYGCSPLIGTPTVQCIPRSAKFRSKTPTPAEYAEMGQGMIWATPQAQDAKGAIMDPQKLAARRAQGRQMNLKEQVQELRWQTPTASDGLNCKFSRQALLNHLKNHGNMPNLCTQVASRETAHDGGRLNPDWVEWLMAWPIGWSACEPLETAKFLWWQQSQRAALRELCSKGTEND